MHFSEVMTELQRLANSAVVRGMKRFGMPSENALGVTTPKLRSLARKIGKDQDLSLKLWSTGILEARGLAALTGDPAKVSKRQMEQWVKEFDSWGVCDACCACLFVHTPHALQTAFKWTKSEKEFIKRAGFVMMAETAIHLKTLDDRQFLPMLKVIRREANDERNFVRKAVNWALRQIGKRNSFLNEQAIKTARSVHALNTPSARWVANDALRELQSSKVQLRLREKSKKSRPR